MATKQLLTNYMRLHAVNQLRESVNEAANTAYYVFAGTHQSYPSGDTVIPTLTNSVDQTLYNSYTEMVFGKRVTASDVKPMIKRYDWVANTQYIAYRSDIDLSNTQYYVVVREAAYNVFKCLDNNSNSASLYAPSLNETSADDEYYSTADGYVWKYMYSVDDTTFNKFATADYIPVVPNTAVSGNASAGSVDVMIVKQPGSDYITSFANTFAATDVAVGGDPVKYKLAAGASSATNFYTSSFLYITSGTGYGQGKKIVDYVIVGSDKIITLESAFETRPDATSSYEISPFVLITGDGSGAVARALVNTAASNSIYKVEIIQRGQGYTYVTATVTGNTGGVSNAAVVEAVLAPKGGHGADPEYELGCSSLCFSVTFANTEGATIPIENDFRSVGILKNPLFKSVEITTSSATGSFEVDEIVTQTASGATGVVEDFNAGLLVLTNVSGEFNVGNTVTGATSGSVANVASFTIGNQAKGFSTFDQRHRYTYTMMNGYTFNEDEYVFQTIEEGGVTSIFGDAIVHEKDASFIYLTHVTGTLNTGNTIVGENTGAIANLLFYYPPDIVIGSGEVLYIENGNKISRSSSQSETVKLILQF